MKKAFTLTELIVSIAVLSLAIAGTGVVFKVSIESYRTANATAEIMRNLRAITDQLNADFKGLRKEMPVAAYFNVDDSNSVRLDRIIFFANGDFQSVRQYNGKTVAGNVASIFYGQSAKPDPNLLAVDIRREKILLRKQTIFTADSSLPDPNSADEYKKLSLAKWKVKPPAIETWIYRPSANVNSEVYIPMYMAKGVDDFGVQLWDDSAGSWRPVNEDIPLGSGTYAVGYPPAAFKFTFTLYDSRGIIKDGMTFTHIVDIGD